METAGIDVYGVRVVLGGGREAIWGNEGTSPGGLGDARR